MKWKSKKFIKSWTKTWTQRVKDEGDIATNVRDSRPWPQGLTELHLVRAESTFQRFIWNVSKTTALLCGERKFQSLNISANLTWVKFARLQEKDEAYVNEIKGGWTCVENIPFATCTRISEIDLYEKMAQKCEEWNKLCQQTFTEMIRCCICGVCELGSVRKSTFEYIVAHPELMVGGDVPSRVHNPRLPGKYVTKTDGGTEMWKVCKDCKKDPQEGFDFCVAFGLQSGEYLEWIMASDIEERQALQCQINKVLSLQDPCTFLLQHRRWSMCRPTCIIVSTVMNTDTMPRKFNQIGKISQHLRPTSSLAQAYSSLCSLCILGTAKYPNGKEQYLIDIVSTGNKGASDLRPAWSQNLQGKEPCIILVPTSSIGFSLHLVSEVTTGNLVNRRISSLCPVISIHTCRSLTIQVSSPNLQISLPIRLFMITNQLTNRHFRPSTTCYYGGLSKCTHQYQFQLARARGSDGWPRSFQWRFNKAFRWCHPSWMVAGWHKMHSSRSTIFDQRLCASLSSWGHSGVPRDSFCRLFPPLVLRYNTGTFAIIWKNTPSGSVASPSIARHSLMDIPRCGGGGGWLDVAAAPSSL